MQTNPPQGPMLHDKQTLGEPLTPEEQIVLDAWYALQDKQEAEALYRARPENTVMETLQMQIDAALAQMQETARNIQQAIAENKRLKQDIASLRRLLNKHSATA